MVRLAPLQLVPGLLDGVMHVVVAIAAISVVMLLLLLLLRILLFSFMMWFTVISSVAVMLVIQRLLIHVDIIVKVVVSKEVELRGSVVVAFGALLGGLGGARFRR